jgi:hypothetical protein
MMCGHGDLLSSGAMSRATSPSVKDDAIIIRVDLARGAESDQVNLRALTQTIREVKRDGKNVVSSGR